jgi:adenylate cyclase
LRCPAVKEHRQTGSGLQCPAGGSSSNRHQVNERPAPLGCGAPIHEHECDPEQEYFSDGITEDIITDLSKVSGLFVIARNTAFTYKGKA